MQRRSIRKVIQEPIFTENVKSNIKRRNQDRTLIRTSNNTKIASTLY